MSPALPYFTEPLPETTTVYDTKSVALECHISEPAPVTWFKNSVEIPVGHEDYIIKTGK